MDSVDNLNDSILNYLNLTRNYRVFRDENADYIFII